MFLNVRPLWPIAQVILMSHLFAGATVVLGGRFDPDRLAATDRRRAAPPARRWCRRSSCAGSSICRRAGSHAAAWRPIYVGGSRIPSAVFERALDLLGPRIGVLYGMTEAPICCYLPPQELAERPTRAG